MHLRPTLMVLAMTAALAACSAPKAEDDMTPVTADTAQAATTPAPASVAPEGVATPAAHADTMADMSPEAHAAMDAEAKAHAGTSAHDDHAAAAHAAGTAAGSSGVQSGWYTAGTFRACGSATALKVDKRADIDEKIKAAGMSASDPVYVQLEGMPMGSTDFMATRVVQVGSRTPVRDCPMTGTTTQVGG